jgi:predicted  nucleic acid-binding Zn-ribbon protein
MNNEVNVPCTNEVEDLRNTIIQRDDDIHNLTVEKENLQDKYDDLDNKHTQLQEEYDELKDYVNAEISNMRDVAIRLEQLV